MCGREGMHAGGAPECVCCLWLLSVRWCSRLFFTVLCTSTLKLCCVCLWRVGRRVGSCAVCLLPRPFLLSNTSYPPPYNPVTSANSITCPSNPPIPLSLPFITLPLPDSPSPASETSPFSLKPPLHLAPQTPCRAQGHHGLQAHAPQRHIASYLAVPPAPPLCLPRPCTPQAMLKDFINRKRSSGTVGSNTHVPPPAPPPPTPPGHAQGLHGPQARAPQRHRRAVPRQQRGRRHRGV